MSWHSTWHSRPCPLLLVLLRHSMFLLLFFFSKSWGALGSVLSLFFICTVFLRELISLGGWTPVIPQGLTLSHHSSWRSNRYLKLKISKMGLSFSTTSHSVAIDLILFPRCRLSLDAFLPTVNTNPSAKPIRANFNIYPGSDHWSP